MTQLTVLFLKNLYYNLNELATTKGNIMKILYINHFKTEVRDAVILPRIGENVAIFYYPYPVVKNVVHVVDKELVLYKIEQNSIKKYLQDLDFDVVVYLE